jgi:hypothetical protein
MIDFLFGGFHFMAFCLIFGVPYFVMEAMSERTSSKLMLGLVGLVLFVGMIVLWIFTYTLFGFPGWMRWFLG